MVAVAQRPAFSTSYVTDVSGVRGSTTPRLFTPPLVTGPPGPCGCGCALTRESSFGFDVDDFAREVLRHPLDAWQRWLVIHGGELREDGSPRFSTVLVLVSRQNGKTELLVVLSLYWQFVEAVPLILGTSTKIDYAKESWKKAVKLAERTPELAHLRPAGRSGWKREANGEQESWTTEDARYKIAASNAEGGRSLSIDRLILDELRQHTSYEAWDAAEPATSARPGSQIWALSNAGDSRSVVLNDKRGDALAFIEDGEGDDDLGLFEWSAEEDADPLDIAALAQANPNLGYRKDAKKLLANARRAVARGGDALTGFKTEHMCIRVKHLNPAIDPGAWSRCAEAGGLEAVRARVALCLDVAPDLTHATLYAAAVLPDDRVRVDFVQAWDGTGATEKLRRDLPALIRRVRPRVLGWLPGGPAAALAADLVDRGQAGWPPKGVAVEGIRADLPAVCMGFAEQVTARRIVHSDDPLLNAHVGGAERLKRGDVWVFSRKGEGHVDALYAAAGAAHLARTLPPPVGKPRLIVAS